MGANTGLLDVCDLGPALSEAMTRGKDLLQTLREYEAQMIPRGRAQVLQSRAAGNADDTPDISGGRLDEQKAREDGATA